MTGKEKKLRRALKAYGVVDEEAVKSFMAELESGPDEEDDPAPAEEQKAEDVGEASEVSSEDAGNPQPEAEAQPSSAPEDGDKADEVGENMETPVEDKPENSESGEVPPEVEPPMEEPAVEQPSQEPNAEANPEQAPQVNYEEHIRLLNGKVEELGRANEGYNARLKAVEEIVAALGQKEVIPPASSFGGEERESPTGKDYVDARGALFNKLNK